MKRIPVLSVAVLLAVCLAACALPEEFSEKIGAAASVAEDSAYTQGETGTEADTETATEAAAGRQLYNRPPHCDREERRLLHEFCQRQYAHRNGGGLPDGRDPV